MAKVRVLNLGSLNHKVSPMQQKDGDLLACVNLQTNLVGAKQKRPGYSTFLGTTPNGSAVDNMFVFEKEDGTSSWIYANAGGKLYYYDVNVGTADAWTICGNGTITAGELVGNTVLNDTLVISQNNGTTRHTTDGTSFTDTSLAPAGNQLSQGYNRVFISGTSSTLTYSSLGNGTNWLSTGTADSSSLVIPGAGKINGVFSANNKIVSVKTSGKMHTWDSYSRREIPTTQGFSSPFSRAEVEGFHMGITRLGYYGFGGGRPEILSNAVEKQIYNSKSTGINGAIFDSAPGVIDKYNYMCAVGTVNDDIIENEVTNAVHVYNYQLNEWFNFSYGHNPDCFVSYKDNSGDKHLLLASSSQVYKVAETTYSDSGKPIEAYLEGFIHFGAPETEKLFHRMWAFSNRGCQAKIQIALSDTFHKEEKEWVDIGGLERGRTEYEFPTNGRNRGGFLFYRLYESSSDERFTFYGFAFDVEGVGK